MDRKVLPAIAEITLDIEVADQPAIEQQAVTLGGFAIVLVNLGQSLLKVVDLVVHQVLKRQLDPLEVGKHLAHLFADIRRHAIIVTDVQKAASLHPGPQVAGLRRERPHCHGPSCGRRGN